MIDSVLTVPVTSISDTFFLVVEVVADSVRVAYPDTLVSVSRGASWEIWEIFVAVASALIAIAALCLSAWVARETRAHNRMSVMPRLAIEREVGGDGSTPVGIFFRNTGVGPMEINKCTITANGEEFDGCTIDGVRAAAESVGLNIRRLAMGGTEAGEMKAAGDRWPIVERFGPNPTRAEIIDSSQKVCKLQIVVDYSSVYGEPSTKSIYPEDFDEAVGMQPTGERT